MNLLHYYDQYVFSPLQNIRLSIFSRLGWSVGDWLYLLLIVVLIGIVYTFIKRYIFRRETFKGKRLFKMGGYYLLLIVLLVLITWTPNYNRRSIHEQDDEFAHLLQSNEADAVFIYQLVDSLNALKTTVVDNENTLNKMARNAFAQFTQQPIERFNHLHVKYSLFGNVLAKMGINGYYNPITSEAQINKHLIPALKPFVYLHEMMHQLGIAQENEANNWAFLVGAHSTDSALRYAVYFEVGLYLNYWLKRQHADIWQEVVEKLNDNVLQDFKQYMKERQRHKGVVGRISMSLYDVFLKMHLQNDGIKSYGQIVHLAKYSISNPSIEWRHYFMVPINN